MTTNTTTANASTASNATKATKADLNQAEVEVTSAGGAKSVEHLIIQHKTQAEPAGIRAEGAVIYASLASLARNSVELSCDLSMCEKVDSRVSVQISAVWNSGANVLDRYKFDVSITYLLAAGLSGILEKLNTGLISRNKSVAEVKEYLLAVSQGYTTTAAMRSHAVAQPEFSPTAFILGLHVNQNLEESKKAQVVSVFPLTDKALIPQRFYRNIEKPEFKWMLDLALICGCNLDA